MISFPYPPCSGDSSSFTFTFTQLPIFAGKIAVVTGVSGFIGYHFAKRLLQQNWFVYGIDYKVDQNKSDLYSHPNMFFIQEDIVDLQDLPDCDYVFNFAAQTHVANSIEDSKEFIHSNVEGVRNLLELIRRKPDNVVKKPIFCQISTDEVYGDAGLNLEPKSWTKEHTETDPLNPSNPYSASKAAGDMLVLAWARTYNLQYLIIRPTNNYGTHQKSEKLIPLTLRLVQWKQKIRLHNNGNPVRCWLHVEDTVDAILTLVEQQKFGIYNVSGSEQYTNRALVGQILNELNIENHSEWLDFSHDRPGQDMRYAIDDSKLKALGWNTKRSVESELPIIVNWYLLDIKNRLF